MASTDFQSKPANAATVDEPAGRRFSVETLLLFALFAASFLIRLWPMSATRFWDETVYLQNAATICCGRTNYSELGSRPPLLSLVFAGVFLFRQSIYAASIVAAALNAIAPLFLYRIGRRWLGKTTAAISALLLAFGPFFVSAGNSLLSDSPALTLILVCFWLLVEGTDAGATRWVLLAGFSGALAVLMRFASLPTIAVLALLCLRPRRPVAAVFNFAIGFAAGFGPYLLWSRLRYGGFLATLQHGWTNVAGSVEPASYYLRNFPAIFSWLAVAGIFLWLILALFKLERRLVPVHDTEQPGLTSNGSPRWLYSRDLFLGAWIVVVLAYYMAIGHKELRYILPLAPPVLLLAGRGLAPLLRLRNTAARAITATVLLAAFAFTCAPALARLRGPFVSPYVSEEKEISDYLKSVAPANAVVYANFNYPVFAYYTGLPMQVIVEPRERFYDDFPDNMPRDGFLVLYRELDLDPRMDWVDSNPHFRRLREFPSVIVYEYRTKAG